MMIALCALRLTPAAASARKNLRQRQAAQRQAADLQKTRGARSPSQNRLPIGLAKDGEHGGNRRGGGINVAFSLREMVHHAEHHDWSPANSIAEPRAAIIVSNIADRFNCMGPRTADRGKAAIGGCRGPRGPEAASRAFAARDPGRLSVGGLGPAVVSAARPIAGARSADVAALANGAHFLSQLRHAAQVKRALGLSLTIPQAIVGPTAPPAAGAPGSRSHILAGASSQRARSETPARLPAVGHQNLAFPMDSCFGSFGVIPCDLADQFHSPRAAGVGHQDAVFPIALFQLLAAAVPGRLSRCRLRESPHERSSLRPLPCSAVRNLTRAVNTAR